MLTFANTAAPFGYFNSSVNSPGATRVKGFFTQIAQSGSARLPSIDLSLLSPSKTPYLVNNAAATLEIRGGTIAKGRTYIIVATGDVRIGSDITYTADDLSSLADLPQVVIIARNISIDENVQNVDAWLIADAQNGVINTCASYSPTTLTTQVCNKQLKVNGPVVTNRLLLYRTHGSEGNTPESLDAPAEIFNNRGDAYLWAYNYLNKYNLVTTNQLELPPRY